MSTTVWRVWERAWNDVLGRQHGILTGNLPPTTVIPR